MTKRKPRIPEGETGILTHIPKEAFKRLRMLAIEGEIDHAPLYRQALLWALDDREFREMVRIQVMPWNTSDMKTWHEKAPEITRDLFTDFG